MKEMLYEKLVPMEEQTISTCAEAEIKLGVFLGRQVVFKIRKKKITETVI